MTGGDLSLLEARFREEIRAIRSFDDLNQVKARYIGKKGDLTSFLHRLGDLPREERPSAGAEANRLKGRIEEECQRVQESLKKESWQREIVQGRLDVTLPGRLFRPGKPHPITRCLEEVEEIFTSLGFSVFEGPEIETDFYNFEALNIPADHPARDMQDTFYISEGGVPPFRRPDVSEAEFASGKPSVGSASPQTQEALLLRTHTSPVQIHVMEKYRPPIRMIAPGVVYRRDSDVSHSPMFHQVEGLVVGGPPRCEGIRFSDLKGVLEIFLKTFFGREMRVRFRPSYFPFTEPSAEVDVEWGDRGWLEVVGCGMVHPNVFRKVHYDPKKFSGFAFGMGIERLAMLKWGIPDIRLFFENDLRFLGQS